MRKIIFIICVFALSACSKSSYEACVDKQTEIAKRQSPKDWQNYSDTAVQLYCRPGN